MSRSIRLALVLFSLALTLTGSALACRTFRNQLDALETQAMLQHQRTVCGVESDFTAACAAARAAVSTDNFTTPARIGDSYTRAQQLILGASTPAFALLRDGTVEYSNTGLSGAALQQAATDTDTILLRDRQLLLASVLNTNQNIILVSAVDAAEAYTARDQLLLSWLAVQALVTLAALAAGWHYGKVQELNARQSRFVADLTHELKTPLTSMIGYADLLRGGTLDDARRRTAADAIYHESTRLESLSQQLLALQGLQKNDIALQAVDVAAVFHDVARSLPNAPLTLDAPAGATVQADRVLLADLLRNLAVNALHASTPDNTVRLICTDAGNGWRLAVIDTGCGIPAEAVPHLTEPFYRVDKARARADGGSGIGLALCAEIATAFGTKLNFASEVGAGTTVSLTLPKGGPRHEKAVS